jgi:hypothetical protein
MTLAEFKAWFEGFTEGMAAAPDEDQWKRIKARVAEINGAATPYPIFVDRYVEPYRRYWPNVPYWSACGAVSQGMSAKSAVDGSSPNGFVFNSSAAMLDLGKAEYRAALNN